MKIRENVSLKSGSYLVTTLITKATDIKIRNYQECTRLKNKPSIKQVNQDNETTNKEDNK